MEFLSSPVILKTGESNTLIKINSFAPGTYYVQVQPNNNALLSSLLVTSCPVGCSVIVNYFQTTSENENVERSDLISHNLLTSPSNQADQILVTKIHNKVFAELVITGGTVVCGLYATAVSYSVGDFEGQFRYNMEQANLGADQGLPVMGVNEDESYQFLPIFNNTIPISLNDENGTRYDQNNPLSVQVENQPIAIKLNDENGIKYDQNNPLSVQVENQPIAIKLNDENGIKYDQNNPLSVQVENQPIAIKLNDENGAIFSTANPLPVRISDDVNLTEIKTLIASLSDTNKALLVRSTLVGTDSVDGTWRNLKCDEEGRLITSGTAELLSPLPSLSVVSRKALASGATVYTSSLIPTRTAIIQLTAGGRQPVEVTLSRYSDSSAQLLPGGGANSVADVALWTNTSTGDNLPLSWTYDTAEKIEGTGSARLNFLKSDLNNIIQRTYTWSTPQDLASWRYIRAQIDVTGTLDAVTRTAQIRLTSGTAIRVWQFQALRNDPVWQNWATIIAELENPTLTEGTGTFDINSVNSISLRMTEGNNKTGSIYWDNVRFTGSQDILAKIYSPGQTTTLTFNPVIVFQAGETVLLQQRNNGSVQAESQATVSGVTI